MTYYKMEPILEEKEDISVESKFSVLKNVLQRFRQPTLLVTDCSCVLFICTSVIFFSFYCISDNLLDVLYSISHETEAIATVYTQILTDLRFAFMIIGGLLSDCLYGRLPLFYYSLISYALLHSISLLLISFFSPSFYIILLLYFLSTFLFGIAFNSSLTLFLNYSYLQSPFHIQTLSFSILKLAISFSLSLLFLRTIIHIFSFSIGFMILSILSSILLVLSIFFIHSLYPHLIIIPLHGNPLREYSDTCRILSHEYHYSIIKPNQTISQGNQILQQASVDYYSRSVSRDSLDGQANILHSCSLDQYYITQEVSLPPTQQAGVTVKVLTPLRSSNRQSTLLADEIEERKNRETAMLFQNGIRTNLIGRFIHLFSLSIELVRLSKLCLFVCLQIPCWCCFEYIHSIIQQQSFILSELSQVTSLQSLFLSLAYPLSLLFHTLLLFFFKRYSLPSLQFHLTSLLLNGWGIITLLITILFTILINVLIIYSHPSIFVLLFSICCLACCEVLLSIASILFYYQESPRRTQSITLSFYFASRYCGSLLFYILIPVLNTISQLESVHLLIHYEIPLVIVFTIVIVLFILHSSFAHNYTYITEKELDTECEELKTEYLLHPYLNRNTPIKKNRSKSYESSRSSSNKSSLSDHSLSDEVILINSASRSISTAY